jgi:hypothetical protein
MSRKGEAVLRKTVYGAALAAGLFVMSARAEDQPAAKCAYREEALAEPAPAAGAAVKDKHRVTLLGISPVEGAEVRADSVVELDVEYHVAGFAAEKFFLMVGFPTVSLGLMSPDDGGKDVFHLLKTPSGKVHLCVPLEEVYEHPGVRWPLSLQVSINEQFTGHSQIVTSSRKAQLNSVDVPAGALERQDKAPPEDVQRAVTMVFSHVELQGALNKVCPARFPAMQTKFVRTYRAWESRNAANIRQIQELQYDAISTTMRTPAAAAMAFDAARNASIKYLSELKDPELRRRCEAAMDSLGDETGDLPLATPVNLEIVQDYLASKKKSEAAK